MIRDQVQNFLLYERKILKHLKLTTRYVGKKAFRMQNLLGRYWCLNITKLRSKKSS